MARWPEQDIKYTQNVIAPGIGVDSFHTPASIGDRMASDIQDFSFRRTPELTTRRGREAFLGPIQTGQIRRIHIAPDGNTYAAVCEHATSLLGHTNWYRWDGTYYEWTLIDNPSNTRIYEQMASWYDRTNSEWQVFWIDGEAVGHQLSYYSPTTGFAQVTVAELPAERGAVCVHANRMFASCSSASGNLAFSQVGNPLEWTSPNGGIIHVGSGAERVIALYSLTDRLFIGTSTGIYVLFGQDEDNFVLQPVSTTQGMGDSSVFWGSAMSCSFNDTVYFSDGHDVYEYSGGAIRRITRGDEHNGVTGGFPERAVTFNSMECDGTKLVVTTSAINSDSTYDWYVFNLDKRTWHIERGTTCANEYTALCRNEHNRIVAVESYGDNSSAPKNPRLYILDADVDYDNVNQYSVVSNDVVDWTPTHGIVGGANDVVGNGSAAHLEAHTTSFLACTSTHEVYVSAKITMDNAVTTELRVYLEGSTGGSSLVASKVGGIAAATEYTLAGWVTLDATFTGFLRLRLVSYFVDAAAQNGKTMAFNYVFVDDISFSYGIGFEPTQAEYVADFPTYPWYLNATTAWHYHPQFSYTSPAFQIRPSAKKTLRDITISADLTDAITFTVSVSSDLDSTSFTTVYTMPSVPSLPSVTKIKVPISTAQKSEWVRVKISGTGAATIINMALGWRIVERTK